MELRVFSLPFNSVILCEYSGMVRLPHSNNPVKGHKVENSSLPYLRGKSNLMRDIFFNNFIKNPGILCTNSFMSSLDIPIFSWQFGQYPTQYAQALYPLLSSIYILPSFAGLPFFVCIVFYNWLDLSLRNKNHPVTPSLQSSVSPDGSPIIHEANKPGNHLFCSSYPSVGRPEGHRW